MNIRIVGGQRSGELISVTEPPVGVIQLARPLEAECSLYSRHNNPPRERVYDDRYRLTEVKRGMSTEMVYALDGMSADQVVAAYLELR